MSANPCYSPVNRKGSTSLFIARFLALSSILSILPSIAFADSAALIAAWNTTTAFSGTVRLKQFPAPTGAEGFLAEGSASYRKQDGAMLSRQFLRYEPDSGTAAYGITNVYDGEHQWVQRPTPEGIEIFKMLPVREPADFLAQADWDGLFSRLAEIAEVRWLPSETLDGVETFVLDVTLKESDPASPVHTTRSWFSKTSGIPLKAAGLDGRGRAVYEWRFTIEKVNPPLVPTEFRFEIPANSVLHDLTRDAQ